MQAETTSSIRFDSIFCKIIADGISMDVRLGSGKCLSEDWWQLMGWAHELQEIVRYIFATGNTPASCRLAVVPW